MLFIPGVLFDDISKAEASARVFEASNPLKPESPKPCKPYNPEPNKPYNPEPTKLPNPDSPPPPPRTHTLSPNP